MEGGEREEKGQTGAENVSAPLLCHQRAISADNLEAIWVPLGSRAPLGPDVGRTLGMLSTECGQRPGMVLTSRTAEPF